MTLPDWLKSTPKASTKPVSNQTDWRDVPVKPLDPLISNAVLAVLVGVFIGWILFRGDDDGLGFITNVFTELGSIILTILVLDRLNERRSKRERIENLQMQLRRNAGSTSNEIAKDAIYQLREFNDQWLDGDNSLLKGARLRNLAGADLSFANLYGANFLEANLALTYFSSANLKLSQFQFANLQGADLFRANLEGANLIEARLNGADLREANMRIAIITNGRISATFDENTTLPDGTKWTPNTDMARFTDPEHPEFWQPEWAKKDDEHDGSDKHHNYDEPSGEADSSSLV